MAVPGPVGRFWTRQIALIVLGVLLYMLMLSSAPVGANPFVDVPAGHWAYGALEQLSDASLIDGYSPGFFTGARRLTRYEMALSVAGALVRLKAGGASLTVVEDYDLQKMIRDYNTRQSERPLTASEAELLRAVVVEFRDELEMLGYNVPDVVVSSPPGSAMVHFTTQYLLDGSYEVIARHRLLSNRHEPHGSTVSGMRFGVDDEQRFEALGKAAAALSRRAVEVHSGVALGRIGSTVLLTEAHSPSAQVHVWERTTMPLLDGSIHLSEYVLPGALLSSLGDPGSRLPFWPGTETLMGVEDVAVTPYLSLAGERAHRSNLLVDTGATAVRATVLLGTDVSLAGRVRTVEPGFSSDGDAIGLGLTVRLGDVLLSTGRDIVQRPEEADVDHVTSWFLEYSLDEQAQVRAGWQSVSDTRSRTSVDVNVPVPQGALRLGLAYEGARDSQTDAISMTTLTMAGLDVRVLENAEARAAFSLQDSGDKTERTTSLGLRYALSPEAALLLGYKFIDFTGDGDDEVSGPENVTTAEFSIRF